MNLSLPVLSYDLLLSGNIYCFCCELPDETICLQGISVLIEGSPIVSCIIHVNGNVISLFDLLVVGFMECEVFC